MINPAYTVLRPDIVKIIPRSAKKILDVGCSTGAVGEQIKKETKSLVWGIEANPQMAEIAKSKLDNVIEGNVEQIDLALALKENTFDCIIFADILEHLRDPWGILKIFKNYLTIEGVIIASIPNIRHYTTAANLILRGEWPFRNRGLHDKSHLRFFTLKTIHSLFSDSDLKIMETRRNYRIFDAPHRLNKFAKYIAIPPFQEFLTYQYLVTAKQANANI